MLPSRVHKGSHLCCHNSILQPWMNKVFLILFSFLPSFLHRWSNHGLPVRPEGSGGLDVHRDTAGLHISSRLCPGAQVSRKDTFQRPEWPYKRIKGRIAARKQLSAPFLPDTSLSSPAWWWPAHQRRRSWATVTPVWTCCLVWRKDSALGLCCSQTSPSRPDSRVSQSTCVPRPWVGTHKDSVTIS